MPVVRSSDSMRALVAGNGRLDLCQRPLPSCSGAADCLIRVSLAGICGTDLEILAGYAGFAGVPGHEFVGVVERAPEVAASWIGRRVVGEINIGCGACQFCRDGVREHCTARSVLGIRGRDGAFAEYVSLPSANLHAVADSLPDEAAVFAEPLAAACRVVDQLSSMWRPALDGPLARCNTAVIGDGRLGLLVTQVLSQAGARVTVVGRHDAKLSLAHAFGAQTMRPDEAGGAAQRFDVVVEASGGPSGLETAMALVRPRGTIVLKSTFHGTAPIATWPIVVDEVTIVGSRCGPFPVALDLLERGAVDVRSLVSAVYPLSQWRDAFAAARDRVKILLNPRL